MGGARHELLQARSMANARDAPERVAVGNFRLPLHLPQMITSKQSSGPRKRACYLLQVSDASLEELRHPHFILFLQIFELSENAPSHAPARLVPVLDIAEVLHG